MHTRDGLTRATLCGARSIARQVPAFRPQAALHFLHKVINLEPLSPMLPSNASLLAMTDKQFDKVLDKWTDEAKSPPYVRCCNQEAGFARLFMVEEVPMVD